MQVNKATSGLLKRIEPYIAFGNPSLKSVKELVYKRGYAKVCARDAEWTACWAPLVATRCMGRGLDDA
jgi:hypothetical protein